MGVPAVPDYVPHQILYLGERRQTLYLGDYAGETKATVRAWGTKATSSMPPGVGGTHTHTCTPHTHKLCLTPSYTDTDIHILVHVSQLLACAS